MTPKKKASTGPYMQLGDLRWRVDPNSIDYGFQLDVSRIETLGGQVVQILGSTLSDLVITGDFGMEHTGSKRMSWELAEAFHARIQKMMDDQSQPAKVGAQSKPVKGQSPNPILTDAAAIHRPLHLTYTDGIHNFDFQVLIKDISDPDGGQLVHSVGKFSYRYSLTLFIVSAESERIVQIAKDLFLTRYAAGMGWKQSEWNGPLGINTAIEYIKANGGSVSAFLDKALFGEDPSKLATSGASTTGGDATGALGGGVGGKWKPDNGFGLTVGTATPPWPAPVHGVISSNAAALIAFSKSHFGLTDVNADPGRVDQFDHPWGKAVDNMIPDFSSDAGIKKGWEVAHYYADNPNQFGTKYILWRDYQNDGSGWQGPGSGVPGHFNHVHVSLY